MTTTDPTPADPVRVDVWSDIACPWCYIGKRKFEQGVALAGIPVAVEYHAFELAPDLPQDFEGSEYDYLEIRGFAAHQVEPLLARIVSAAEPDRSLWCAGPDGGVGCARAEWSCRTKCRALMAPRHPPVVVPTRSRTETTDAYEPDEDGELRGAILPIAVRTPDGAPATAPLS